MSKARAILRDLVEETQAECAIIARDADATSFSGRPYDAVRLFYPFLTKLQTETGTIYANRTTGWGTPSLLQELLLGVPVMIDLVNGVPFNEEYGMTSQQLAGEIRQGRVVAVINVSKPLDLTDGFLELIRPILETKAVQLAHFRTGAFQDWYTGGLVATLEDKGGKVFDEYFSCRSEDERKALCEQLRVHKYREPWQAARRAVAGRWRNIVSICPGAGDWLIGVFHDLRDHAPSKKAEILNGVKNLLSGPISAGRGGMYRAGPQDIQEISRLTKDRAVSERLSEGLDCDLNADFATSEIIRVLERRHVLPVPQHLDYDRLVQLTSNNFWQTFRNDVGRILEALAVSTHGIDAFLSQWEEVLNEYRRALKSYKRVDKYYIPFLGLRAPFPGFDLIAAKFLCKIEETLGTKRFLAKPGRMLAQLVWKADRAEWPPISD